MFLCFTCLKNGSLSYTMGTMVKDKERSKETMGQTCEGDNKRNRWTIIVRCNVCCPSHTGLLCTERTANRWGVCYPKPKV